MNRRQIATKLALEALAVEIDLDTFDQRLIIQKTVYLAQAGGADLGYYYRWYLRGPYSPDLTSDVFGIESELKSDFDESEGWRFNDESQVRLEGLRSLIPSASQQDRARRLEMLASVHFLVSHRQVPKGDSLKLQQVLQRYDKDFSLEEIDDSLRVLRKHGLLPSRSQE